MRVRQSTLKQFGGCARQYYYSKVLDLGGDQVGSLTVLGTVWHFAAEVYENYDYDLDLAIRTFKKYWKNPELLGATIDFWHNRTTHRSLEKRGVEMLKKYHELAPWREGRLVGSEIHFVVPIGDHELEGTIDKLWVREGYKALEVVDFKTGSYVPQKLRHNIQFTAYCYATHRPEFWEQVPGYEGGVGYEYFQNYWRGGWWYHARNGKMFNAGKRGELDFKRLRLAVEAMAEADEKGVYPLDVSGENCGWCPYAEDVCGSEVESPVG